MKLSEYNKLRQHGRIIARAMDEVVIQKEKSMIKVQQKKAATLENEAEKVLSGNNIKLTL